MRRGRTTLTLMYSDRQLSEMQCGLIAYELTLMAKNEITSNAAKRAVIIPVWMVTVVEGSLRYP